MVLANKKMKSLLQVLVFVFILGNFFQVFAQRKITINAELENADRLNSFSLFSKRILFDFPNIQPANPTITVLSSNYNAAQPADTIKFTSTTTSNGSPVNSGTVSFTKNATPISGCTNVSLNSNGQANCTTSRLEGTGTIIAKYNGTSNFGVSDGSLFIKATYLRLGVRFGSYLVSNKEQFEFTLDDGQKVVIKSTNPSVYFNTLFKTGQKFNFTQTAGPRNCNLFGTNQGTFNDQDILVSADCSYPPLTNFKLQISGIEQGEIFKFADNYGRRYQYPFSTLANIGGYPQGDDYTYIQTDGPRPCRMQLNQGVVPNTPLIIQSDCSKNPGSNPTNANPTTLASNFPQIELVSRSSDDKSFGTFYDSTAPVIGGKGEDEGRFIAYVSYAVGLGGSKGKFRQIIWRDRKTGETRVISSSTANGEGNGNSFAPAISADGKSVAFESYATNLVPVDSNGVRDVFVWNYDRNTISAVSDAPGGIEANSEAFEPTISADGRYIAFSSSASTLTQGVDGISTVNVFLKDMQSGTVTLISLDEKKKKGGGGSNPSISDDGSRIAFYNYFPLTSDDKNTLWDIYVWQRGNPKLKRVSMTAEGTDRDQGSESSSRVVAPTISGNGQFVTFATTANNMVGGDTNKVQDAFVVEIDSGRVSRLSLGKDNQEPDLDTPIGQGEKISITSDGKWVVFSSNAKNLGGNILLKNIQTGEMKIISNSQGITVGRPDISRDGNYVIFGTNQRLDSRFQSSGIFVNYVGLNR